MVSAETVGNACDPWSCKVTAVAGLLDLEIAELKAFVDGG
jgi:hypothetical protein